MKLRTRLNLVLAGLTATFVVVLLGAEVRSIRVSLHEEIEAANRVASQLLGRLAEIDSREGGTDRVLDFLDNFGRVRANDITLQAEDGTVLYRSPQSTYKAGRTAPPWFSRFLAPEVERNVFTLPGGTQLAVQAEVSRAVLDAWDDLLGLVALSVVMLVVVNGLAFWLVGRALAPFPVIAAGLERIESGDLAYRLPPLRATKPARSARRSIAWRRPCRTRCRPSARRATPSAARGTPRARAARRAEGRGRAATDRARAARRVRPVGHGDPQSGAKRSPRRAARATRPRAKPRS